MSEPRRGLAPEVLMSMSVAPWNVVTPKRCKRGPVVPAAVAALRERRRGSMYWLGLTPLSDLAAGFRAASVVPAPTGGRHEPHTAESHRLAVAPAISERHEPAVVRP